MVDGFSLLLTVEQARLAAECCQMLRLNPTGHVLHADTLLDFLSMPSRALYYTAVRFATRTDVLP